MMAQSATAQHTRRAEHPIDRAGTRGRAVVALHDQPQASAPSTEQLAVLPTFFQLSRSLSLSNAEECALLNLSAETMARVRSATIEGMALDRPKLWRRLEYAILILRRMLEALPA